MGGLHLSSLGPGALIKPNKLCVGLLFLCEGSFQGIDTHHELPADTAWPGTGQHTGLNDQLLTPHGEARCARAGRGQMLGNVMGRLMAAIET